MKTKSKITIGLVSLVLLVSLFTIATADLDLTPRDFNITDSYTEIGEAGDWICYKIQGYPNHEPCFEIDDTYNRILVTKETTRDMLISARLDIIDNSIEDTNEHKRLSKVQCRTDSDCISISARVDNQKCYESRCITQEVYDKYTKADSLKNIGGIKK